MRDEDIRAFVAGVEAAAEVARECIQSILNAFDALAEVVAPLVNATANLMVSWWRCLPPYTRSWLMRRFRYGDSPVHGSARLRLHFYIGHVPMTHPMRPSPYFVGRIALKGRYTDR